MRTIVVVASIILSIHGFAQFGHYTFGEDGYDCFQQILPIDDSTFYVLGTKTNVRREVWLVKMNHRCEVLSEKTYGDSSADLYGYGIQRLADGMLMIVGEQRTGTHYDDKSAMAIKLDAEGEQIWRHLYTGISALFDVLQQGTNLLFLGWYDDPIRDRGYLLRTTHNGTEWMRIPIQISYHTWPRHLFPVYTSDIFVVGRTKELGSGFTGIFVQRTDKNGQVQWTRTYDTQEDDFPTDAISVIQDPDDSVWISSPTGSPSDIGLIHYSASGDLLKEIQHGSVIQSEYPYSLTRINSDFLITGRTMNSGFSTLIDDNGAELWREYYRLDMANPQYVDAITVPGGFLLAGIASNTTVPDASDALITKIRVDGSILPWKVKGKVLFDKDNTCAPIHDQLPVSDWFVTVRRKSTSHPQDTQIFQTNAKGEFTFYTYDAFSTFTVVNSNPLLWDVCNNDQYIRSSALNPEDSITFFVQEADPCQRVEVSVTQPDLIRCDTSCMIISLQNQGLSQSVGYTLRIELDPGLTLTSCSEPFVYVGNLVEIEILPIAAQSMQVIDLCVSLTCTVQPGATHLISASIEPLLCEETYDGPKYTVKGNCEMNASVFQLSNIGGESPAFTTYRVFADNLLVADNVYADLREHGSVQKLSFPADGRTWRLELEQASGFPGVREVHADVEGCGTGRNGLHSIGYRNLHSTSIGDHAVSEVYIPNTTGVPNNIAECIGGAGHYNMIDSLQPFEFSARVLNSLDHDVHKVEFVLEFSATLDIQTFAVTAANASVMLEYQANQIIAIIENITIRPGQSAMLRFRISPMAHVPPDEGSQSLMLVEGYAYLDDAGPINLQPGFLNYTRMLPIEVDEYNDYQSDILLFGGRNYDFGSNLCEGPEQTLILVGESNSYSDRTSFDAYAIKTNLKGQAAWVNAFDLNESSTSFYGVAPLEDGGCIAAGNFIDRDLEFYASNSHMYIVRLDSLGKLQWERIIRPVAEDMGAWTNGMIKTNDDHFLVFGYTQNTGGSDQFYCKLNEHGEILWVKHTEITGSNFRPENALLMQDGGIIVLGTNESTVLHYDTYLEKIDRDGNVVWSKGYNSEHNIYLGGLATGAEGELMVTGFSQWVYAPNDYVISPTFIKFDRDGNFLWEKNPIVGPYHNARVYDIAKAPGNTYLVTGEMFVDTSDHFNDILLMKIDENADTIWTRSFGAKNTEWAERVIVLSDGNIALWGFNQPRPPFYDLQSILVVTDNEGFPVNTPFQQSKPEWHTMIIPNPVRDAAQIILSPEPEEPLHWQMLSLDGRLVKSGYFGVSAPINLSTEGLCAGLYLLAFPGSPYPGVRLAVIP